MSGTNALVGAIPSIATPVGLTTSARAVSEAKPAKLRQQAVPKVRTMERSEFMMELVSSGGPFARVENPCHVERLARETGFQPVLVTTRIERRDALIRIQGSRSSYACVTG